MVIAEQGLDVTRHVIDITRNANFDPDYMRINPKGVVPTIVDDGAAVCNGPVIAEYLDGKGSATLVHHSGPGKEWAEALSELPVMLFSYSVWVLGKKGERSADILADKVVRAGEYAERYPELAELYLRKQAFFEAFRARVYDGDHVAAEERRCAELLERMGAQVAGGGWLAGDELSFADCGAASVLYRLIDLGKMDGWSRDPSHGLHGYYERLQARPSFRAVYHGDPNLA